MKRIALWAVPAFALFLLVTAWPGVTPSDVPGIPVDDQGRPTYVPGEVLVQLADGLPLHALGASPASMLADAGSARRLGATGPVAAMHRVRLVSGVGVGEALMALRADPAVASADPNYLNYKLVTPSDAEWLQMWGMENTGQVIPAPSYTINNGTGFGGVVDADVDASLAWDTATGVGVLVAVIDDGLDYSHPDLSGNVWNGSGGASCPGGGLPTTYGGCDFAEGDNDPYPIGFYHGTHVAGTIAASANGIGVPGMAYNAKIMGLKVFPDDGGGASDADIISAINYAAASGAHIANLSLGRGGTESSTMTIAVATAINAGLLLVVAAGNEANNNNTGARWPANYAGLGSTAVGVISVAATDQADQLATFSNYGSTTVSIGAPGVNILSSTWDRSVVLFEDGNAAPGTTTDCASTPATCMDNTIFAQATDCVSGGGVGCKWGSGWDTGNTVWFLVGDISAPANTYANNIDGTVITVPNSSAGATKLVLRYSAAWDMECGNGAYDYVDVEVFNGSTWQRLTAPNYNVNDSVTALCSTTHTHTGRMASAFGGFADFSYDITAYQDAAMQVRFRFVTDGSVNSTGMPGGIQITGVTIDQQGGGANPYGLLDGTSMASPMVAGIAALVKQAFPAYSPSQIKHVILDSGDAVGSLSGFTVSGRRANAATAVSGSVTPPPPESATVPTGTPSTGGGGGGGCLVTWATAGWLPDSALEPLRGVRETLWQSGDWGRAVVRAYYRGSAAAIGWLESGGLALRAAVTTARL